MSDRITNPHTAYIRFLVGVDQATISRLIATVEQKLKEGVNHFVLLISSPGGNVYAGISGYNFLKGIPAEVTTHNFGTTDSIATVLYCAGSRRYCVPHARFLLHGIGADFQNVRLNEKFLDEQMKSLKSDRENISKIIADACQRPLERVEQEILQGTVLNAEESIQYGLAHEIRSQLFESGAEIIAVQ